MRCPYCSFPESKVLDTRSYDDNASIKRRRECLKCQKRFTSFEAVENLPIFVVKKDGSRQIFDKNKILIGLSRACEKRPVSLETLENVASEIEQGLRNNYDREISSSEIGHRIIALLKKIDQVAYIRFVSVYHSFSDVESFLHELEKLRGEK